MTRPIESPTSARVEPPQLQPLQRTTSVQNQSLLSSIQRAGPKLSFKEKMYAFFETVADYFEVVFRYSTRWLCSTSKLEFDWLTMGGPNLDSPIKTCVNKVYRFLNERGPNSFGILTLKRPTLFSNNSIEDRFDTRECKSIDNNDLSTVLKMCGKENGSVTIEFCFLRKGRFGSIDLEFLTKSYKYFCENPSYIVLQEVYIAPPPPTQRFYSSHSAQKAFDNALKPKN